MIAQLAQDKLLAEIVKDEDHRYFDILYENEKTIDWLGFAAKLYRRSHSTGTITSYCKGICAFRDFAKPKTLTQVIEEIRIQTNGLAYKLLDDFVTWCDGNKTYAPRTTRNYFQAVTRLFLYLDITLDENKLANISLPRPSAIKDEIPSNEDLRKIDSAASPTIRAYMRVMRDTGFEPVDAAQLRVKDFKFDEKPIRINKDREKTGEPLEGFLSQDTIDAVKQLIAFKNKQANDFVFTNNFTGYTLKALRDRYNFAVAKAGFGKVKRQINGRRYLGIVEKIDGHKFGKFHLKIFKKRWFTLVVASGIPAYVAHGMLGRKQYLDEYMRLSIGQKREFAIKILKTVSIYGAAIDKKEVLDKASEILGFAVKEGDIAALKTILANYHRLPELDKAKLLGGGS